MVHFNASMRPRSQGRNGSLVPGTKAIILAKGTLPSGVAGTRRTGLRGSGKVSILARRCFLVVEIGFFPAGPK